MLDARRAEKDFLFAQGRSLDQAPCRGECESHRGARPARRDDQNDGFNDLAGKVGSLAGGFDEYRKRFSAMEQTEIKLGLNEKLGLSGALRAFRSCDRRRSSRRWTIQGLRAAC